MIVEVYVRNSQAELILLREMESDAIISCGMSSPTSHIPAMLSY
jgi:hypothetical protein